MTQAELRLLRFEAMAEFDNAHFPEAIARLNGLIEEIGEMKSPELNEELCHCLTDRSTVLRTANRWKEALADVEQCTSLAETLPPLGRAGIRFDLHDIRAKLLSRRYTPVYNLDAAYDSLSFLRNAGVVSWIADEMESDFAFQEGDWRRSAELALRTAEAMSREGWIAGAMMLRLRAVKCRVELGEFEQARMDLADILPFFRNNGPTDQCAGAEMALARIESASGNHENAWSLALSSLDSVEDLLRGFKDPFEQQRFLFDKMEYYHQAFRIGWDCGSRIGIVRAWTIAERAKSFYLCSLVANADVKLFDGIDESEIDELGRLENELDAIEIAMGKVPRSAGDKTKLEVLERERDRLSSARRILFGKMLKENPRWASLRKPQTFEIESAISRFGADWTPVSYFWQPKRAGATLYVFYTDDARNPRCVQSAWTNDDIAELDSCKNRLHDSVDIFETFVPGVLTEKIIPPVLLREIGRGRQILVSPHGRLAGLPIHALEAADGSRLMDEFPVQYIPALSLVPPVKKNDSAPRILLIGCEQNGFGDRALAAVPAELNALEALWSAKRPGAIDKGMVPPDGTLHSASLPVSEWKRYGTIHLACHGTFPPDRPLDAALRLGSEALRVSEFFNVCLDADTICMSACSMASRTTTDDGVELRGDAWIGMYLPLFYAGAKSMLASLWNANSELAAKLMPAFHAGLAKGLSPARAFHEAIRSVSSKPASLWANWYLVGYPN